MAKKKAVVITQGYYGRKKITTSKDGITRDNVVAVINDTFVKHQLNCNQINFLEKYYNGNQPILSRVKQRREDIDNKVVENRAKQIADFCTSFAVGDPLKYVSSDSDNQETIKNLRLLNNYLAMCDRPEIDVQVAEWQDKVGTGYKVTLPAQRGNDVPFIHYSLDPRDGYVIYKKNGDQSPIANVFVAYQDINVVPTTPTFGVYTLTPEPRYFEIYGGKVVKDEPFILNRLPLVEYPLNSARIGSFEAVLPILDAINLLESNRLDGVEQFIQSLLVFYNCTLGEDEDGNQLTTEMLREQGTLFIKSLGENKADVKELTAQLDQQQTQTLVKNLWLAALSIVGMPSQGDGNSSDSSNNGAVSMKNGWTDANTRAKKRDVMYIASEMKTLSTMLAICRAYNIFDMSVAEILIKPTRRNQDNLLVKVQALTTMLGSGQVAPIDAFTAVDLFSDPEEAAMRGIEWYKANSTEEIKQDTIGANAENREFEQ